MEQKRHYDSKFLLVGAIITFILGYLFMQVFVSGPDVSDEEESQIAQEQASAADIPDHYLPRLSDGVFIDPEDQVSSYIGVMVENSAEAWPLSGLSEARLVIEAPVEGNIPRFFVVFDDKQEIDSIGPVRSARPYYVRLAYGMQALYAHVGGSPDALAYLKRIPILDVNEFYFGQYFRRESSRYAPHNVYTSIQDLLDAKEERSYEDPDIEPLFTYAEEAIIGESEQAFTIPFSAGSNLYDAGWKLNLESNQYDRYQSGKQQFDENDDAVVASNVIVVFTNVSVIDEVGRKKIRTEGEGDAIAYVGGQEIELLWKKDTPQDVMTFHHRDSLDPLLLNRGATWIEFVSTGVEIQEGV